MSNFKVIAVDVSIGFTEFLSKEVENFAKNGKKVRVIFPNVRPLRFIEKNLSLKSLLNTELFSMGDFVKDTVINYSEKPPKIQDEIDRLFFILNVLKQNRNLYTRLGGEDFLVFPWVKRLSSLFSEIDTQLIENVKDFEYFETVVEQAKNLLENLNSLYLTYRKEVEGKNVSFGGDIYKRCVQILESGRLDKEFEGDVFVFAGFSYLTNSEKRIINFFKENFETYIYFQTDTENRLHRIKDRAFNVYGVYGKWLKGTEWGEKPEVKKGFEFKPNIEFYESYDVHSEVRQVVKVLKKVLGDIKKSERDLKNPKKIGIILPDSKTLFPLLFYMSKLEEKDLPKNITMGFPLSKTGFGDFLERLFKTLVDIERNGGAKVYVPVFLKLLKSEIMSLFNLKADKSLLDILFNYLIENNIVFLDFENLKQYFEGQADLENFAKRVYTYILKPFIEAKDIEGLYSAFENLYSLFDKDLLKDSNYLYDSIVLDYFLTSVVSRLDSLKDEKGLGNVRFNQRLFYSIINTLSKSISIPFEGNPLEGVQIMGMLESRSLSFDYLFVLDVNEGVLPNTEKIDPLMPEALKFELGLSGFKEREKLIKYNFFRLIDSSKNVFIFYQSGQTTLEKKTKSRFVEQLLLEKEFEGQGVEVEKSPILLPSLNLERGRVAEGLPCEFKEGIEKTDWIREKIEHFFSGDYSISATFIDDYLQCPYMFYLKRIANIKEKAHLEESQRADKVGSLIHHVLEKGFAKHKGEFITEKIVGSVKKKVLKEVENFVDKGRFKEFEIKGLEDVVKYIKNLEPIKKEIFKKVAKFRLNSLFDFFMQDAKKEKPMLIDVEKPVVVRDFKLGGKNIKLYGKIDRVEKLQGDKVRIIDYKTGSYAKVPSKNKLSGLMADNPDEKVKCVEFLKKSINSIQLAFYIYLYSKSENFEPFQIESCLYLLGESKPSNIKKGFSFEGIPNFSALEDFEKMLILIFNHMKNSDLIIPTPGDACQFCDYNHFCRYSIK